MKIIKKDKKQFKLYLFLFFYFNDCLTSSFSEIILRGGGVKNTPTMEGLFRGSKDKIFGGKTGYPS